MTATTVTAPTSGIFEGPPKPAWRFARERKLGRIARQLLDFAEAEIPLCVALLGADAVLAATRADGWALACLGRAADCEDESEAQGAWVLLAACRPRLVRRAIQSIARILSLSEGPRESSSRFERRLRDLEPSTAGGEEGRRQLPRAALRTPRECASPRRSSPCGQRLEARASLPRAARKRRSTGLDLASSHRLAVRGHAHLRHDP